MILALDAVCVTFFSSIWYFWNCTICCGLSGGSLLSLLGFSPGTPTTLEAHSVSTSACCLRFSSTFAQKDLHVTMYKLTVEVICLQYGIKMASLAHDTVFAAIFFIHYFCKIKSHMLSRHHSSCIYYTYYRPGLQTFTLLY